MLNTHDAPKNDMQATVYIDSLFVEVSSALIVQYIYVTKISLLLFFTNHKHISRQLDGGDTQSFTVL